MNDEEIDRLTRQAFDDLHRIAISLENMSAERLISEQLISRLTEIALRVSHSMPEPERANPCSCGARKWCVPSNCVNDGSDQALYQ